MKTIQFASLALVLFACSNNAAPTAVKLDAATAPIAHDAEAPPAPTASDAFFWSVHFSPNGGCTQSVDDFIHSAQTSVRLQAYGFTSRPVADALIERGKVGKDVQVILDKSDRTAPSSQAAYVAASGVVKVFIDPKHQIAHNKVIVVDGAKVETGSFNYTGAAESGNAENCLILGKSEIATAYTQNWNAHLAHSVPYSP